jgi:HlyD family secretion protein
MDSPGPKLVTPRRWLASPRRWLNRSALGLRPFGPRQQLGAALALMGGVVAAWATVWLVPTEVVGKGVLLLPENAGLLDARAAGQVRRLPIRVGDRVKRGQVLVELYLPVLEKELEQQRANLRELERQNLALDERDRLRLETEKTALKPRWPSCRAIRSVTPRCAAPMPASSATSNG